MDDQNTSHAIAMLWSDTHAFGTAVNCPPMHIRGHALLPTLRLNRMPAAIAVRRPFERLSHCAARALLMFACALALASLPPVALLAQPAPAVIDASRQIAAQADSIATAGDTARAYAMLDSALRKDKSNAAAWLQFGLLNWNMAKSERSSGYIKDQRAIRLLRGADSALRLATQFAPDSARYWLMLSRFNLTSDISTMRFAAGGQAESAVDAATKTGDKTLLAIAADEVGMATWRRYEAVANRALTSDNQRIQLGLFNNWSRDKARDYVNSFARKIDPPTGQKDFVEALGHFRTALDADPTNLRISRHVFMALGEHRRWEELRELARTRARAYPLDYQSRLAIGLASHRLADEPAAGLAFDSAFALMDDDERARMTRFTRLLRPRASTDSKGVVGDTVAYGKLPPAQQRGLEAMYWLMSDPLTLTSENEYRLEFLARVTYADFRWTNEDFNLLGADTDRGDIFIRYGPPELEMTVLGTTSGGEGGISLIWGYTNGLLFFFDLPPGFGTARFAFSDRDNVDQMKSAVPVSWANVASTRVLDTIPIRVTRFRRTLDSSDVVVAAYIPIDSLVRGLDIDRAALDVDVRVYDQFVRIQGVESEQTSVNPDSANGPVARTWTRRLGPGINVVRVEALQADSKRAARALTRLDPQPTSGFGMSDVLLGDSPKPKSESGGRRWTDFTMQANVGIFAARAPIGMLWELYELAERDGQNRYRLAVSVERVTKGGASGFAARLFDGVGRTLGREQRGRNSLTISFDRAVAAANTLVEYLSLDLSDSPVGEYRLRVESTDLVSQKKASRETTFCIR